MDDRRDTALIIHQISGRIFPVFLQTNPQAQTQFGTLLATKLFTKCNWDMKYTYTLCMCPVILVTHILNISSPNIWEDKSSTLCVTHSFPHFIHLVCHLPYIEFIHVYECLKLHLLYVCVLCYPVGPAWRRWACDDVSRDRIENSIRVKYIRIICGDVLSAIKGNLW